MFIHSHLIDFQITHLVMHRTHGLYWNHRVRWGVVVISAEVWWKFWVSTSLPLCSHSKEWKGYLLTARWRWKSIVWTWSPLTLRVRFYTSWWGWKSWSHTCFLRHHPAEGAPTRPCWHGWGGQATAFFAVFCLSRVVIIYKLCLASFSFPGPSVRESRLRCFFVFGLCPLAFPSYLHLQLQSWNIWERKKTQGLTIILVQKFLFGQKALNFEWSWGKYLL